MGRYNVSFTTFPYLSTGSSLNFTTSFTTSFTTYLNILGESHVMGRADSAMRCHIVLLLVVFCLKPLASSAFLNAVRVTV